MTNPCKLSYNNWVTKLPCTLINCLVEPVMATVIVRISLNDYESLKLEMAEKATFLHFIVGDYLVTLTDFDINEISDPEFIETEGFQLKALNLSIRGHLR